MASTNPKQRIQTAVTLTISLAVAAFFMWLAFRDTDFKKIGSYFIHVNYAWIAAAACFAILAYWLRAYRWRLLFQPLGYSLDTSKGFWSIAFGYLMNLTIPRSGEVARATALYRTTAIPVEVSFGTVILERVIDLLCMVILLALALVFKADAIAAFYEQAQQTQGAGDTGSSSLFYWLLGGAALAGVLIFIIAYRFRHNKLIARALQFLTGIWRGILSITKLKQPVLFIFLSAAIWISYFFASYLICFALPATANFTPADGLFIIVIGTLGMIIPASGGIGAFHFALKVGIGALFLSWGKSFEEGGEVGIAYAFVSHTMQTVITLVLGLLSIYPIFKNKAAVTDRLHKN